MRPVPALSVPGLETRSFVWHPTVGSAVVSYGQRRLLPGVRKLRFVLDREAFAWRVQVAASPAGHAAVSELVVRIVAEHDLGSARPPVLESAS